MKRAIAILMMILVMTVTGCSDQGKELYETAQLEELQNSREHAMELYREIISKFPDGKYSKMAQERLAELE